MSVLPVTRIETIEFCEIHNPVWEVAPTSIGLTALMMTTLKNATISARASYNAAQSARELAKAATTTFYANSATMRTLAADYIRQIKAYADLQANPATVYAAAQIPEPAAPTPATAPGRATDIEVNLEPSGAVTLSWTATDAAASSGGFFNIARKLPGQSSFMPIGSAPGSTAQVGGRRMSFTDFTVPTSAAQTGAQYIIQGRRGNLLGLPSDAITVQFGVDGGGMAGVFAVNGVSQAMKMAA